MLAHTTSSTRPANSRTVDSGARLDVASGHEKQPMAEIGQCTRRREFVADFSNVVVGRIPPGHSHPDEVFAPPFHWAMARVLFSCSSISIWTVHDLDRRYDS